MPVTRDWTVVGPVRMETEEDDAIDSEKGVVAGAAAVVGAEVEEEVRGVEVSLVRGVELLLLVSAEVAATGLPQNPLRAV